MGLPYAVVWSISLMFLFGCNSQKTKIITDDYVKYRVVVDKDGDGEIDTAKYIFNRKQVGDSIYFTYKSLTNRPSFTVLLKQNSDNINALLYEDIQNSDTIQLQTIGQIIVMPELGSGFIIYSFYKNTPYIVDDDEIIFINSKYGVLFKRRYHPRFLETLQSFPHLNEDTLNYLLDAIILRDKFFSPPSVKSQL